MAQNETSRRRVLMVGGGVAGAALAAGMARAAAPSASKVPSLSKASVGYRDVPWRGEVCGACQWFEAPSQGSSSSHCKLVAGPISPAGWCQAWTRR